MDKGTAAERSAHCQAGRRVRGTGEEGPAMTPAEIRCVVGIDVAKQGHVVCALEARSGALRQKPSQIEATREGYTLLLSWLATWRAGAQPEAVLIGLDSRRPGSCGSRSMTRSPRRATACWSSIRVRPPRGPR